MIRNIVFDMGRVLVDYEGDKVCKLYIEDEAERRAVTATVFDSQEWLLLDMGLLSEEEALKRMQARLQTDHEKEMAALCFHQWHEVNMKPNEEMGKVVRDLKNQGYGIYLCSNASVRLLTCYQMIPGIEHFDGILFSAEVKCIKPQKEMYEHFFERFQLNPEECFFIDDLSINIEGAKACKMDGYCFEDGDIGRLMEVLSRLNA